MAGLPLRHAARATSPKQGRSTLDQEVYEMRICLRSAFSLRYSILRRNKSAKV